jgi:hypothetical protein
MSIRRAPPTQSAGTTNPRGDRHNLKSRKGLKIATPADDPNLIRDNRQTAPADPHKAVVDQLWPRLSEATRRAIAAMAQAGAQ